MGIAAERFKSIGTDTNIAIANFKKIADNGLYSTLAAKADLIKMEAADILNNPDVKKLKTSINSLLANGTTEVKSLTSTVTTALNSVVKTFKLPADLMAFATSKLKDFGGTVNSMVQTSMDLGKKVLCPITGMLDYLSSLFKFNKMSPGLLLASLLSALNRINKKLCSGGSSSIQQMMKAPSINMLATKVNSAGKTLLADAGLNLKWDSSVIPKGFMSDGGNVIKYTKLEDDLKNFKTTISDIVPSDVSSSLTEMFA